MQGAFQIPVSFDTGTNKIVVGDGNDFEPLSLPAYTGADAGLVTTVTDPDTGGIREFAGGKRIVRSDVDRAPGAQNVWQILSSPPTVSVSQTNPLAAGQLIAATTQDSGKTAVSESRFTYTRAGSPQVAGINADAQFIKFGSVTYPTGRSDNSCAISFIHEGPRFVVFVKGGGSSYLVKINDKYTTLTPYGVPSDGNFYYIDVQLGTTEARRIEIIGSNAFFGGVYIGATDSITPAPIRGPRVIVTGDSFTEGTGSTMYGLSWVNAFAEFMGWDDVWQSGVGATGYVKASGGKLTCVQRAATDLYPFAPDICINANGINDNAEQGVYEAATQWLQGIKAALPNAATYVIPGFWKGGAATLVDTMLTTRGQIRQAAIGEGATLLDVLEMPIRQSPHSASITNPIVGGATSIQVSVPLIVGSTYSFQDGTRFAVKSQSGLTVQIDGNQKPQAANAIITEVGPCFWTGLGKSGTPTGWGNSDRYVGGTNGLDETHPTIAGHKALGIAVADLFVRSFK